MKVLFAVSNESTSQAIIKKYQSEYKQIISYKNVYYFNAILKELQRDKSYDRVVISEDLEQYVNADYEQMDKFLFDKLDSISDEASNINGEDIPIILICTERRNKSEQILVKLFGIGIYNAIIGNDRSATEVCRLINRPRSKKEAKVYYKIDSDDVSYGKENENDVSELEIQNILSHYKRIGNDEEKYVESFDSIAEQYNDIQLKVISKCLPLNVRAVLEEKSQKYQQINSYNNKITDKVRVEKKSEKPGTSEILLRNDKTTKLNNPVIIPSNIDTTKKKKILTKTNEHKEEKIKTHSADVKEIDETVDRFEDIEIEEIPDIKEIPLEEYMPETDIEQLTHQELEEEVIEPVKRGRGRPKKSVPETVSEQPKRKRGRPKKNIETEEKIEEEETTLPGFNEVEEEQFVLPEINGIDEEETTLPGFDEEDEELSLPGFDEEDDEEEELSLPGFDEEDEEDEELSLPGFDNEDEVETILTENESNFDNIGKIQSESSSLFNDRTEIMYPELDMSQIMSQNQKLVAFVGTSKNGTSFLVNNVAEILSMNGIDTAILDLTRNRNSYYIYTKNDEQLRNQSNYITNNLKAGVTNGIIEHKNLTIYTSPIEGDENLEAVEPIVETLVKNHTVVLMDCDFMTPMKYFSYANEIYLVQSMDILTIQPLTAFLRQLIEKGMFEPSKARVVLNKFIRTREITENILIGGMSIYNDPGMSVRKELFDRKNVPSAVIPFDLKSYLRYLDGLVTCDISLKGYDKEFLQSLKNLANMVYENRETKKKEKYMPPSVKNNNGGFSPRVSNTLDQMRKNY